MSILNLFVCRITTSLIAKPLTKIHDPVFSPYIVHVTGEAPAKDLHSSFIQEYAESARSTACSVYYVQMLISLSLSENLTYYICMGHPVHGLNINRVGCMSTDPAGPASWGLRDIPKILVRKQH